MVQRTYIGLSPNFSIVQSGQSIVFSAGTWVPANFLSADTSFYTKEEADARFYSISGGTIYGGINAAGYNVTASTFYGNLNWSYIQNTPTTLAGYGITDAYTKTEADNRFVFKTGDTMTGQLFINVPGQQALVVSGNTVLSGDLYVIGTTTTVYTENMNIRDNLIVINSGETGAGVTQQYAGFIISRGTETDYLLVFDETQDIFRIGLSGNTQAVATREDNPINNSFAIWNNAQKRFDTTNNIIYSASTLWLNNNISVSGNISANTFYGNFAGTITTDNLSLINLTATTAWINTLNATNINYNGQNIDDVFVNVNGDTMTGTLTVPLLTATTVSATTLHGNLNWNYIQNTPTTLAGYGITDAYTKTESDAKFVFKTGDTMTGELIIYVPGQQALTVAGNVNMTGNLYVSGTTTYVNTEDLNIKDNLITINSGETGAGVTKLFAGIRIDRGTLEDYVFLFDEIQDNFRIGMSNNPTGGTQAIATREDNPISGGLAIWNSTLYRFDTTNNLVYSASTLWSNNVNALVVSAETLHGNLDWSYISNKPNFDGLYYSISGGTIYGSIIPNTNGTRTLGADGYMWSEIWLYDRIILRSINGVRYEIRINENGYLVTTPLFD